ncbi:MAG: hypothetical protein ABL953_12460 [Ilumatobacteraceae bacterium]
MHAAEQLVGWRIIATPTALDAVKWPKGSRVVRISPDDVFLIGAAEPKVSGDGHAIVTPEHGFSGIELTAAQVASIAEQHIEWQLPTDAPANWFVYRGSTTAAPAQGQIAGVPAKLLLNADGTALLLVACAASHELLGRLGLAS